MQNVRENVYNQHEATLRTQLTLVLVLFFPCIIFLSSFSSTFSDYCLRFPSAAVLRFVDCICTKTISHQKLAIFIIPFTLAMWIYLPHSAIINEVKSPYVPQAEIA